MKSKLKTIISLFSVIVFIFMVIGCPNPVAERNPSITISAITVSVNSGDDISFVVSFTDFETVPVSVNVYSSGVESPFAENVTVTNGTFKVSTANIAAGTYSVFVKVDDIESNQVEIQIKDKGNKNSGDPNNSDDPNNSGDPNNSNDPSNSNTPNNSEDPNNNNNPAPSNGVITIDVTEPELECNKDFEISLSFSEYDEKPTLIDIYFEDYTEPLAQTVEIVNSKCSFSANGYDIGEHQLYVKDGDIESNRKTIKLKTYPNSNGKYPPDTITITKNSSYLNRIDILCDGNVCDNGYEIFYSKTPSLKTAQKFQYDEGILYESGTYYFWARRYQSWIDGEERSSFGEPVCFENFVYTPLVLPDDIVVEKSDEHANVIVVTWTPSGAFTYYIKYGTVNNIYEAEETECRPEWNDFEPVCYVPVTKTGTYYIWFECWDDWGYLPEYKVTSECYPIEISALDTLEPPKNFKLQQNMYFIDLTWDVGKNDGPFYELLYGPLKDGVTEVKPENLENPKQEFTYTPLLNHEVIFEWDYNFVDGKTYYFWIRSATSTERNDPNAHFSDWCETPCSYTCSSD